MCVLMMMSDCQEMIKLWISVSINLSMSGVLCNISLGLWFAGVEH
jgi:hypothetical protein